MNPLIPAYVTANPPADINECRIVKITVMVDGSPQEGVVEYNSDSNPISVTFPDTATGVPNYEFKYDIHSRLSDCIQSYSNGAYMYWIKYYYDDRGRVVLEVVHRDGQMSESPAPIGMSLVWNLLKYDDQDRIIEEKIFDKDGDTGSGATYTYDAGGNREFPGAVYDDRLNFRKTNKVWMLLERDYSLCNRFVAQAYNLHDLPTQIGNGSGTDEYAYYFLNRSLLNGTIEYSCS